jgi:hypothetical protein
MLVVASTDYRIRTTLFTAKESAAFRSRGCRKIYARVKVRLALRRDYEPLYVHGENVEGGSH